MIQNKNRAALPMLQLTFPIAVEQFFRILVSSVDTMMLSSYSNDAVAAVGLVSQYSFFITLVFSVISTGCSIVLAQHIGAAKTKQELNHIAQASAIMVFLLSIVLTFLVIFGTEALLNCYELEIRLENMLGVFCYIWRNLLFSMLSCFKVQFLKLRLPSEAMIVFIIANIVNVVGNALSLYGWFGCLCLFRCRRCFRICNGCTFHTIFNNY